jgi:xanthine/uracil permease
MLVPDLVSHASENVGGTLGKIIKNVLSSPITSGGITVIILNLILGKKA